MSCLVACCVQRANNFSHFLTFLTRLWNITMCIFFSFEKISLKGSVISRNSKVSIIPYTYSQPHSPEETYNYILNKILPVRGGGGGALQ